MKAKDGGIALKTAVAKTDWKPHTVLIAAFVLALIHQYFFYGYEPGVAYPLFVCLFYGYMWRYGGGMIKQAGIFGWFLAAVIGLLSLTFMFFRTTLFYELNLMVVPALIFLHMAYLFNGNKHNWDNPQLAAAAWSHLVPRNVRHWAAAVGMVKSAAAGRMEERRKFVLGRVALGLALACPILVVVLALLSSADGVFSDMLSFIPERLGELSLGDGIARGIWVLAAALFLFGYVQGFADKRKRKKELEERWKQAEPVGEEQESVQGEYRETGRLEEKGREHPWSEIPSAGAGSIIKPLKLDAIITATVLVMINAVYILFVAVQFSYLFGGWEGALPEGSTYAEYARSGFMELVVVTALNYALLLISLLFGEKAESRLLLGFTRLMLFILVICSCVMLYSAYVRLDLYEEAYGYTVLRLLVHAFMILLGLLLVAAGMRGRLERIPLVKCYIVMGLTAYVIMNYISIDNIIAGQNIERYRKTGKLDLEYLLTLSNDALPRLAHLDVTYPELTEDLVRRQQRLSHVNTGWQGFNVADHRAKRILKEKLSYHSE
jgi:hypothetical protein